jgi:hypothetical protein
MFSKNKTNLTNIIMSVVNLRLTIPYGTNSTLSEYLDIVACLCTNNGTCNFQQTTTITAHYQLASCDCLPQYDGIFHKSEYSFLLISSLFLN